MASASPVIRVDETAQQRRDRLERARTAMAAVGDTPPPADEKAASDAALEQDRRDYGQMNLEDVLEREIKLALAEPYDKLWAKDRHQLIKAGVGLLAVKNKIGPKFGGGLGGDDEEDE